MSEVKESISVESIAKVAHSANKAYCEILGDPSQKSWEETEPWQRESMIKGIMLKLEKPELTPQGQHEAWMEHKISEGWTYGPVKDAEKKEHHCLVPYEELPVEQRRKDYIIQGIVAALTKD